MGGGSYCIDVATARQRGILVSNTPGMLTEDTTDMTMVLVLALTRRIPEGLSHMQLGDWSGWQDGHPSLGEQISGHRLGILGIGQIGQAVVRRASPL